MGFAVPAAMGAKVGMPDSTVWAIDGDGCFQMTNQELATCAINDIPIKVAIINNESLGMVRQWQTLFYNERYSNTDLHSKRIPDFVKLAEAYGCVGLACEQPRGRRRHDQQGDGDQRRPGRRRLPGAPRRDGLADGRRRHQQRRHQVRARPRARRSTRTSSLIVDAPAHAVGPRREQARRPGPDRGPVQPPRLQHRVARGRPDRARRSLADDDRGQRRGLAARAGHQAAQQAGRGDQDRRARPGSTSVNRELLLVKVDGRPPRPAARCSTPSSCSAPRSSTSPPDAVTIQATGNADKLDDLLRLLEPFGIRELVAVRHGRDRPRLPLHLRAHPAPGRSVPRPPPASGLNATTPTRRRSPRG